MSQLTSNEPLTFYKFCQQHREDNDDLGDLCSEVCSDRVAPMTDEPLRSHLLRQYNNRDLVRRAWVKYLRERAKKDPPF